MIQCVWSAHGDVSIAWALKKTFLVFTCTRFFFFVVSRHRWPQPIRWWKCTKLLWNCCFALLKAFIFISRKSTFSGTSRNVFLKINADARWTLKFDPSRLPRRKATQFHENIVNCWCCCCWNACSSNSAVRRVLFLVRVNGTRWIYTPRIRVYWWHDERNRAKHEHNSDEPLCHPIG